MIRSILFFLLFSNSLFSINYEIVTETSNPDVCTKILNGLEDFNVKFFKEKHESFNVELFIIYAKDDHSQIIGGINGYIFVSDIGSWASVEYAWVDESSRRVGIGTKLFEKIESLAKMKNCNHIQLLTFDYQAVDFYKKLGFECVGIIPEWIENHDALYFRKKIN